MAQPFSQSQLRLLGQLSAATEEADADVIDSEEREIRLAEASRHLPRLHALMDPESLDSAYEEWYASCSHFITDELVELLENAAQEGDLAAQEGRPFHLSSQLCFMLMQWSHQELTAIELDEPDADEEPWYARVASIYEAAEAHLAALLAHVETVEQEASRQADLESGDSYE